MKMNPRIARNPEDIPAIEFKKMKALIKKDLKRLEKNTSNEKPTPVIIIANHEYPDKPGLGFILFGKWKAKFKTYAKMEVAKKIHSAL